MTLSDTTRQELGKIYSFRSTSRDNVDSHEYHDVKFPGILLCLEYMKRCTSIIRQMQNKPKHSNDITSMLVCCFNVLYYATCPPIDLKSEIVHAPATVEDEYTEIVAVGNSDQSSGVRSLLQNRSIGLESRIQVPTSSTSPNPIFSTNPLSTSSPYPSRRARNKKTLKLFNGQQIMVHYEQYQKGKSLKIPTKADHENKIYALWFLLRRADVLQILKKTMLDEKMLSIIEKAGESGQLSWSALTTTIIMTCVLIIHGMARWEPCRAILQQMGIIEHLQVIKFKNSRDLACVELNDSSDNEDNGNGNGNGKITEVFSGNNGPDRNERPNLNEKNGKNDKNSEKEDKIKAKNRFENLKTQMVEEVDKLIDSLCNHQTDKDTQWKGISQSTALSQTNIRYNSKDVLLLIESHLRKVGCEQTAKQLMKERIWKKEFKPKNNKQDIIFKSIVKRPEIKSKSTRFNKIHKHTNSTHNSTTYSPNTPNKQKTPALLDQSSFQKKIKLKTSLASLLEKHVGREYAANRNHVTTSIPEYRFTKTKPLPKIGQKPIYTSTSRNVLSRIHNMKSRNMQSHHIQMRTYSKHEDQLIYNNYRPRQQMLAYGEGQPTAFHFLSNDVAIVGDSRGTISATKLPQETMEPECYQDSNTLLLANEMFDELDEHEIYQITSSPIARKQSQPIGQSLDWGMMPPNFAITTRKYSAFNIFGPTALIWSFLRFFECNFRPKSLFLQIALSALSLKKPQKWPNFGVGPKILNALYNNGGTYMRSAHIINTSALPERIYSFENVKWLEYSRDNEQNVLATVDRDLTHLDIDLNHTCKLIDLSRDGRVVQEFGMKNSTMNSASLASFNLKCNKAVMQPRTNDKIILSAGVLYDARVNSTMRNSRGNEITKGMISFKLDVIDKHVTNGVFHPYKPEIVRDDCVWDVRYVSDFNNGYRLNSGQSFGGGRIIKNIPELKGSEAYFSETGSVMYSSKAWVSKYQNIMDPTFLTENTNCFTVFNSQTYEKVGFCPTKFPLYDLSFDDRNSHFLAIEKTGLLDSSDLDASPKYEMRFWQIGRRLRVKGEVGPYDFDQGEDYEEGGEDGGALDYSDDSDDDGSDDSDNDGGSDSDSSVDSRVESFSDSTIVTEDESHHGSDDENGGNNDENDDFSVTESEIQAEMQNIENMVNLPEEWENAISTPSDGDADGSDDHMSDDDDDDGPPTNFPMPTGADLQGMFEQVEKEKEKKLEKARAKRRARGWNPMANAIKESDHDSDDWSDTESDDNSSLDQTESPEFTVENLLKSWKETLDLKAIVFLKLESGSELSFEQITQAKAIQIVLKKYPEIEWTTEDQKVYFASLTVLLAAFDKNLDIKDVPKTLEKLKRLASSVPE